MLDPDLWSSLRSRFDLIRHQPAVTLREALFVKCHRLESQMSAFVPFEVVVERALAAQHVQVSACQSQVFESAQRTKNESVRT